MVGKFTVTCETIDILDVDIQDGIPVRWTATLAAEGVIAKYSHYSDQVPAAIGCGKSLVLDGVNDYVSMGLPAELDFSGDLPFSVSAFAFMHSASGFKFAGNYWSPNNVWDFRTSSTGKLAAFLFDISNDGYIGREFSTPLTNRENQWIHVTMTYDGSKTIAGIKLYLDGVQVDDTDMADGVYDGMESTGAVEIGRSIRSYGRGLVDDVRIYAKELSAYEVTHVTTKLIDGTNSGTDDLAGYWRFDGSLEDCSPNENDGKFNG